MSHSAGLSSGKWLVFLESATSIEEFFSDIYVPFDSEFLVAESSSGSGKEISEMSLTEVYRIQPNLPLQKNRLANWSSVNGLSWTTVDLYERRDLQGVVIRCVFLPEVRLCSKYLFQISRYYIRIS
jgi:hypothetical protein